MRASEEDAVEAEHRLERDTRLLRAALSASARVVSRQVRRSSTSLFVKPHPFAEEIPVWEMGKLVAITNRGKVFQAKLVLDQHGTMYFTYYAKNWIKQVVPRVRRLDPKKYEFRTLKECRALLNAKLPHAS